MLAQPLRDEHAEVKLHFHKGEDAYLPLLDQRLTQNGATRMFEAMETAVTKGKGV